MDDTLFARVSLVAACGVIFCAMIFAFRPDNESEVVLPPATLSTEAASMRSELIRCGTLGPADAGDPHCDAIWAENRRHFFTRSAGSSTGSSTSLAQPTPVPSDVSTSKTTRRVLQDGSTPSPSHSNASTAETTSSDGAASPMQSGTESARRSVDQTRMPQGGVK